jgi:putative SOS response-associated peptidase YedK
MAMCGRYALHSNPEVVALQFHLADVPAFAPRYNIAPAAQILAVKREGASLLRWGLRGKAHNLRAESAARMRRRCLIPADGFYEWQKAGSGKQPWFIRPARGALFGFAGVWDQDTCAILTVAANAALRAIHHRMPAIIAPADYARWLAGADGLLASAPDDATRPHPVGRDINSGSAESPALIEPVSPVGERGSSGSLFGD